MLLVLAISTSMSVFAELPPFVDETPARSLESGQDQPCVLLTNGNVLFGTATQQGEWVVVRKGDGNESQLPRKSVACWASSLEDLYQYRVDRRIPGDVDALIADARWCHQHDLLQLADVTLQEALLIEPNNRVASGLQIQVSRRLQALRSATASQSDTELTLGTARETSSMTQQASHQESITVAALALIDVKTFAGSIQPMLINRCGSCHGDAAARSWSLIVPPHDARPSSRMTRENLQNALPFISVDAPDESPLWMLAMTPHGGHAAPLGTGDHRAAHAFREWIHQTARVLQSHVSLPKTSADFGPFPPPVRLPEQPTSDSLSLPMEISPGMPLPTTTDVRTTSSEPPDQDAPMVSRLPQVPNPFDPDLFNRRFHLNDQAKE